MDHWRSLANNPSLARTSGTICSKFAPWRASWRSRQTISLSTLSGVSDFFLSSSGFINHFCNVNNQFVALRELDYWQSLIAKFRRAFLPTNFEPRTSLLQTRHCPNEPWHPPPPCAPQRAAPQRSSQQECRRPLDTAGLAPSCKTPCESTRTTQFRRLPPHCQGLPKKTANASMPRRPR